MVLSRLERVSADSALAHRASGVRGALLRSLERSEPAARLDQAALDAILTTAFKILEQEAGKYSARSGERQKMPAGRLPRE
jgi:hypothetical protein